MFRRVDLDGFEEFQSDKHEHEKPEKVQDLTGLEEKRGRRYEVLYQNPGKVQGGESHDEGHKNREGMDNVFPEQTHRPQHLLDSVIQLVAVFLPVWRKAAFETYFLFSTARIPANLRSRASRKEKPSLIRTARSSLLPKRSLVGWSKRCLVMKFW